jgi:hypothetical protein
MDPVSAQSPIPFVEDSAEPGGAVHTDGWLGHPPLEGKGYAHEAAILKGKKKTPSEPPPRVRRAIPLLKRRLMGTHRGAVSLERLDYYLDEFTFRFNRRKSRSRGKLFFRLLQQAVAVDPAPYKSMVNATQPPPRPATRCRGCRSQVNTHLRDFRMTIRGNGSTPLKRLVGPARFELATS